MKTPNALKDTLLIGGLYGLLGGITNLLVLIPVYGQLTFHFGQIFVLICLLTRGLKPAIVAVLISASMLAYRIDNSIFILLLSAEILVMGLLYQRGIVLLLGNMIYWLLVGIPISLVTVKLSYDFTNDYTQLLLMKQLINGVVYTLLASVLFVFMPLKWCATDTRPNTLKLSGRIFYLSMISTILPALLVALLFTSRTVNDYVEKISDDLTNIATHVSFLSGNYLKTHQRVVNMLAGNISLSDDPRTHLENAQKQFPGFITMLVTDASGVITSGAPESFYQRLLDSAEDKIFVNDRAYFTEARDSRAPYVSDVFIGRGFGNDPIIALSSPLIVDDTFIGIVEGSLNLPRLKLFEEQVSLSMGSHYVVVTDSSDNVIYASEGLPLGQMQTFKPQSFANVYSPDVPLTRFYGEEYLFQARSNAYGWNAYALARPDIMTTLFTQNMAILMVTLLLLSLVFLVVSRRFSDQITAPLVSLIRKFTDGEKDIAPSDSLFMTHEVNEIASELQHTRDVILDFNQTLKAQVREKTAELSELNHKLETMAQHDALTTLPNRRYFDLQAKQIYAVNSRNRQPMTCVAIDIDYFKRINDTHGHDAGDDCLVFLAKLLRQHFNRSSDIVARYGGEEFVMLLAGGHPDSHLKQLERFRHAIEQKKVTSHGATISMTVSMGAVVIKDNYAKPFKDIMRDADKLLYESKAEGRNQITRTSI